MHVLSPWFSSDISTKSRGDRSTRVIAVHSPLLLRKKRDTVISDTLTLPDRGLINGLLFDYLVKAVRNISSASRSTLLSLSLGTIRAERMHVMMMMMTHGFSPHGYNYYLDNYQAPPRPANCYGSLHAFTHWKSLSVREPGNNSSVQPLRPLALIFHLLCHRIPMDQSLRT